MSVRFLTHTRDVLALRSKQAKYKRLPTPEALGEIVQCLLRMGDEEASLRWALEGHERFPDSDLVDELLRVARRERAYATVRRVQAEIRTHPAPELFLELARESSLIHDHATAAHALRECIRRFPTSSTGHAALAALMERRYLKDLSANDGEEVVTLLRRACRLEPSDVSSELRLARFMARLGRLGEARRLAASVVAKDGRLREARELLESIAKPPDEDPSLEESLAQAEEEGRLPCDRGDRRRTQQEVGRLRKLLSVWSRSIGARRAIVLDAEGSAWDEAGPVGGDAFVDLARNTATSAYRTTLRCDLGPPRMITLESSGGSLLLRRGIRCTVAVLLPRSGNVEAARGVLEHDVGHALHSSSKRRTE